MYIIHVCTCNIFLKKTYLQLWLRQAWQFKKNIAIVWETSVNKSKLSSRKIYETLSLWDMLMDYIEIWKIEKKSHDEDRIVCPLYSFKR